MYEILINSVDRTAEIDKKTLEVNLQLTSRVDSGRFSMKDRGWTPNKGDEILVSYDGSLIFGGRITDTLIVKRAFKEIDVKFQDWSADIDRIKIAKVYDGLTAKEIIEDIVSTVNTEAGTSFTTVNVYDTPVFGKVVFDYHEPSKCIEELANSINFHWYIDPQKDLHFFAKGTEVASFSVTDTSTDVIRGSLSIDDSFSELRNAVIIKGGEFEAFARTEEYVADGEQKIFNLAYKYSSLPTVALDAVALNVGVEHLNEAGLQDGTYDCLWDFMQKYLRFKDAPLVGQVLNIEGTPLFPLIVMAEHTASIAEFGRKEHLISDVSLTSQDVAIQRALSDLEAYKEGVLSGSFRTYTHGLRAGQTIKVTSIVDEEFMIKSVTLRDWGEGAEYYVELANNRVVGIIEFLQSLLLGKRKIVGIRMDEVANIIKLDSQAVDIEETITEVAPETSEEGVEVSEDVRHEPFTAEFVIAPYFPSSAIDPKTPMRIGISSYIY